MDNRQRLELAQEWHQAGYLAPGALEAIREKYRATDLSVGLLALYAVGGALLAASGVLVAQLADWPDAIAIWFHITLAGVFLVTSLVTARVPMPGIPEALGVAAGVSAIIGAMRTGFFWGTDNMWPAMALATLIATALWWTANRRTIVAIMGCLGALATSFAFITSIPGLASKWEPVVWSLGVAASIVATRLFGARYGWPWLTPIHTFTSFAFAIGITGVVAMQMDHSRFNDDYGIPALAGAAVGLLFLGLGLKQRVRGWLIGGALGMATMIVAFAFDVGGTAVGLVALLVVAGSLVLLASWLSRTGELA